jgi:hypothetical protein
MGHVLNVHQRRFTQPPDAVASWLDDIWSGTSRDVFPRDVLPTWRSSAGGVTRFGHANLRFELEEWNRERWRAGFRVRRFDGWHGFDLTPEGAGTVLTHTLEGDTKGSLLWQWPLVVRPIHDWAVEALFDRLQAALESGQVPARTDREMPAKARLAFSAFSTFQGLALPGNWGATADEVHAPLPCDAVLPEHDQVLFRAVTVNAAPEVMFRWLCQLRVAPYSYDLIDNFGRQSPVELTPGLERLEAGQRAMRIFTLVSFEAPHHLTLSVTDPRAIGAFGQVAGTYAVRPLDDGRCRLVVKLLVRYPRSAWGRLMQRLLPWGDLLMMRRQLKNLSALAEDQSGQPARQARGQSLG